MEGDEDGKKWSEKNKVNGMKWKGLEEGKKRWKVEGDEGG
jgi:hypothetical protein